MGAGKTTVGACLANRVNLEFVDLDETIEVREGLSILEIFEQRGEVGFRRAETRALQALVAGPLIVLYELGILLAWLGAGRKPESATDMAVPGS